MHAPHTDRDVKEMLDVIGAPSLAALSAPPSGLDIKGDLQIAPALPEALAFAHLRELAARDRTDLTCFIGAGAYRHYQPPVVPYLATRSEFITAYTPYQAEASQGSLQAIFEWQTYICLLTGLDVSNASLYDGSTALVEGVIMASQATGRRKVAISAGVHPGYREVLRTYAEGMAFDVIELLLDEHGTTDLTGVPADVAAVIVQSPNFLGCIEDVSAAARAAKGVGALGMQVIVEAMSLGALKTPAESGADIAVGEAQSFGLPLGYGGPYVGFVACTKEHVRRLPGRLVGETHDVDGRKAYVLTLQGREQHIRRELASSNICTNQALCALFATIYLAAVGAHGLRAIATANLKRARQLRSVLMRVPGVTTPYAAPFFNEFVLRLPIAGADAVVKLRNRGILALALSDLEGGHTNDILVCATEVTTDAEIDRFAVALQEGLARAVAAV